MRLPCAEYRRHANAPNSQPLPPSAVSSGVPATGTRPLPVHPVLPTLTVSHESRRDD